MERGEGMKILLVNGSPRKAMNTATVLEKIAEGARSAKAEAEVVHLIDYSYMGCINCTKHESPFTCPEVAMVMPIEDRQSSSEGRR